MGVFSMLLAIDPLEQDIQQEVASEDAKRQKKCYRHKNLARADVMEQSERPKGMNAKAKKSLAVYEEFARTSIRPEKAKKVGNESSSLNV